MSRHDATLSAEERSRLGAHYTPADMAKTVAERALRPLMYWPEAMQCAQCLPSMALLNLLVIDLACGDGILLSAAADILGELLWEAFQCEGTECSREEARTSIEQNVLLGVDIDPGAIEAARAALPHVEFHCADALFDFDFDTDGRPTAFLMNPPYLGGSKISGAFGKDYKLRLLKEFSFSNGCADLCTYFLLQAAHLLDRGKSKGTISAICTNTINQGRTREAGLKFLLQQHRDTIYCADRDVRWPGAAKVTCSIVHLANEELWTAISTGTESTHSAPHSSLRPSGRSLPLIQSEWAAKMAGGSECSSSESSEKRPEATTIEQLPLDFGATRISDRQPAGRARRRGLTASTPT